MKEAIHDGAAVKTGIAKQNKNRPRVPVLTFVSCRSEHVYECQNQTDTSNLSILVWLRL